MQEKDVSTWRLLFTASENLRNIHSRRNSLQKEDESSITLSQARVLGCLLMGGEGGMKVKNLAAELGITPGGVSQIVDVLVHMGHVERSECPGDRRSVSVRLSESGIKLRRRLDRDFNELFAQVFEDVSAEEEKIFRSVLCKIINISDKDINKQE